jgi:hypothetical protein
MILKTFLRNLTVFFLVVVGSSLSAMASDGVVIKSTSYKLDASGQKTKIASNVMYMSGAKILIKQDDVSGKGVSMIFDSNKNEMIVFMNENEYMIIGEAEIIAIKAQLKSMLSMMEQMKDNLPPEQRKQYEKQKAALNGEASNASYKKVGTETINGHKSDKYAAFSDDVKVSEFYITAFSSFGVSKTDFEPMEKMMTFFREQIGSLSGNFQMGGDASFMTLGGDNPAFGSGVPVKVTTFSDGKATSDNIIENVEKKNIDPDLFKIPANMKKTDLMQMMQGGFNR